MVLLLYNSSRNIVVFGNSIFVSDCIVLVSRLSGMFGVSISFVVSNVRLKYMV